MIEKWTEIKYPIDYKGIYLVSNTGRLFSNIRKKLIKQWISRKNGYLRARVGDKKLTVSVLVALHFVDNPNPLIYNEVNHIDTNKLNNEASNLEWVTSSENKQHAAINGLNVRNLFPEQVKDIKKILKENELTHDQIAELFNTTKQAIDHISCGRTWSYLN